MTATLPRDAAVSDRGPAGPLAALPPEDRRRASGGGTADILAGLIGAAAVLVGASALGSVLVGRSWVLPLVEVVVVVTLLGIGGRLLRIPAWGGVILQLAGLAVALTSLFTTAGIGGVLPNGAAIGQARTLLDGAWQQIEGSVPPAQSSPELSFLIAASVGLAALIVDYLIAQARTPALVALPLLCLYSVPASVALDMLPWYTFAAPAALYALLLGVVGHAGRRTGFRAGAGRAATGAVITAASVVIALLAADTFTFVGTAGRLPRTEASVGPIGLSPFTSLRGNLQRSRPVDLFTVRGLPEPDYLRTLALTTWTNGQGFTAANLRTDSRSQNGDLDVKPVATSDLTVTVTSTAFRDKYLPLLAGTTSISGLQQPWDFDANLQSAHRSDPTNPGTYTLAASSARPFVDDLEQDTVTPGGTLTDVGALPASVRQLAAQVTRTAATPFDKARALQQWFTNPANGFKYSLQVPAGNSGDALVDFLTNKQGYCEQYASAMAVMLRSLGIPTRVGIGFTQGQQQPDGSWVIDSHDAHAWVEVQFDTNGWVRYDPTPLVNGQGGQQGFSTPAPQTSAAGSTSSTSAPATTLTAGGNKADQDTTTAAPTSSTAAADPATSVSRPVGPWWWIAAAVLVLALLLFGPAVVRVARRRARLRRVAAGGPDAAVVAWSEIEDLAVDHGVGVGPAESSRVAANRLSRRGHLGEQDRSRLRAVIVGAERLWYGPGPAGSAAAVGEPVGSAVAAGAPVGSAVAAGEEPVGSGGVEAAGGGTAVLTAPAPARVPTEDLVAAVHAVQRGLIENAPLTLGERWFPRSLRSRAR